MKKWIFLGLFGFVFFAKSFSQLPQICPGGGPLPQGECETACVSCSFSGIFQGSTDGQTPSSVPAYCGSIENDQWFGFVAASSSASIVATPLAGSCDNGDGIQVAVYATCGGPFLQCNVGQSGGGNVPVSINVANFISGQHYFIVVDGYAGDQCDFTLQIEPTSGGQAPTLGPTGAISGPQKVCPGGIVQFCIPPTAGASACVWSCNNPTILLNGEAGSVEIDGPSSSCVTVEIPANAANGVFQLSTKPKNACFEGQKVSKTVIVQKILPTTAPLQTICLSDCLGFTLPDGSGVACDTGIHIYGVIFLTASLCDSVVNFPVRVVAPVFTSLGILIRCAGDCLLVGGEQFCAAGDFSKTLAAANGCDSTVIFSLRFADSTLAAAANFDSIDCQHPFVALSATVGAAGLFDWKDSMGQTISTDATITVFAPGLWVAVVGAGLSCELRDSVAIFGQIAPFSALATGGALGCKDSTATLGGSTTAQNPVFVWSGPNGFSSSDQNPTVAAGGTYILIVGEGGCLAADTAFVAPKPAPPQVVWSLSSTFLTCAEPCAMLTLTSNDSISGPCFPSCAVCEAGFFQTFFTYGDGCKSEISYVLTEKKWPNPTISSTTKAATDGSSNGSISISQVFGGTFPYAFLWSTGAVSASVAGLLAGAYSVTITDAGGCTAAFSFVVDDVLAVKNSENEAEKIHLAPNPTDGSARLFLPKSWAEKRLEIDLFAADGRLLEKRFFNETTVETIEIDLKSQASGLFWLAVKSETGPQVFRKLVKI